MKKYIQLTAGRGPVECARAVTLVARELLKDFPDAELIECEPHNTEPDCYMSMLFLAEVNPAKEQAWSGTVLWRATSNPYRLGHPRKNWFVGVEFIEPVSLPEVSDKDIVYETMRGNGCPRYSSADRDFCQMQHPTVAVTEQGSSTHSASSEAAAKGKFYRSIFPSLQVGQTYYASAGESCKNILGGIMNCRDKLISYP